MEDARIFARTHLALSEETMAILLPLGLMSFSLTSIRPASFPDEMGMRSCRKVSNGLLLRNATELHPSRPTVH